MTDDVACDPSGYYATDRNGGQFMDEYGYDEYADLFPTRKRT